MRHRQDLSRDRELQPEVTGVPEPQFRARGQHEGQLAFPGQAGDWGLALPGVRSNVVDVPPPGARGDLLFYVDADEDGFFCAAVYDENVAPEAEMAELVSDLGDTLRRAAADPDAPADPLAG